MEPYLNLGGNSGVSGYEIGDDFIRVAYRTGGTYLYTYESTGVASIEEMKELAEEGQGLATFINKFVRDKYASRES